jgi:twitching motility protein PilT
MVAETRFSRPISLMAATGTAPLSVTLERPSGSGTIGTDALLTAMLRATAHVSDLVFSPGRPPQVEVHGQLLAVQVPGLPLLTPDTTRHIASDLIGHNKQAITILREQGSCDVSYGLPGVARFRVNAFIQRGSCAIIMRVIPSVIPTFESLRLPHELKEVSSVRDGIVLVTGARGSGKSSTLATLLDDINEKRTCHIITIEDPIEFLHNHKRATIHQRELHSDAPNIATAMKAALRQAPRIIVLSEMRDRETIEMALEAAETGHLVLSSMNTVDAVRTVQRIVGLYAPGEHASVRNRLAKTLRYVISQRLIPRADGSGRVPVVEILKANARTHDCLGNAERPLEGLLEIIKDSGREGMQPFDGEIEKLTRSGVVKLDAALDYATEPNRLLEIMNS